VHCMLALIGVGSLTRRHAETRKQWRGLLWRDAQTCSSAVLAAVVSHYWAIFFK